MQGKTSTGFEFQVEPDRLDDYELLEDLAAVSDGQEGRIVAVINRLLGEDQKTRLKDHLRKRDGKVSMNAMMQEIGEIFKALKVKN